MNRKSDIAGLVAEAEARGCRIWDIVMEEEEKNHGSTGQQLREKMRLYWDVMRRSVNSGIEPGNRSLSGLVGAEGALLTGYLSSGRTLSGQSTVMAAARAMGAGIVNASMGKVVAAPTAGSCGILPAVLMTVAENTGADEEKIIDALFTAAGIGKIIDEGASTSGARAGCQAECGAAAGMAAVAAVEMAGGTPRQAANAGALALKNIIGLVCDPVAGLVEIPCVKRNAMGAAIALLAADMALAGVESKIPVDEVISAMREVGDMLPEALRETALGGLANTPAAREIQKKISKM